MELLWLIPSLPLLGFVILALAGSRMPRLFVKLVGVGSVGASALAALIVAATYLGHMAATPVFTQHLWTWVSVAGLHLDMTFYLDSLALVMILIITFVGFLILLYSVGYMADDEAFSRFFAYMNLFVASMLVLVLAENLLLLYLGWEGVGLCSYLLIGFWYTDPANGFAARKAFVVTRVGDTAMAVGLFLIYSRLNSLHIQEVMNRALETWPHGSLTVTLIALLLLGGAVGKSAQLPLQTWLPDAMAGPTPVSALIHAATMVTAGVYLIARTHMVFTLAPVVMTITAVIGAATLLLAGFSALVQTDIKRVLAYSTISQLGYMFLALGVGAWSAAVFHLMTHAFFKALLFLGAGAIIHALGGEQDMFRMGGLKEKLPLVFRTFLIGSASLSALPLVTAGFYSKDMIIWEAYASIQGGLALWIASALGALLTSLYTFRMMWITFAGPAKTQVHHPPGWSMTLPLTVLAVLSLVAGFIETPNDLGGIHLFSSFMHTCLPATYMLSSKEPYEVLFQLITALVTLGGIFLAYVLYRPSPDKTPQKTLPEGLRRFWFSGWGFDRLYEVLFVRPYLALAQINKNDIIDRVFTFVAFVARQGNRVLCLTQNGRLRLYAFGIGFGAAMVVIMVVLL
jgi:NADH-quinone oxidoreductase subunit L